MGDKKLARVDDSKKNSSPMTSSISVLKKETQIKRIVVSRPTRVRSW